MPTPEEQESWRLTVAARARRRAEHPIPETPRVRVRVTVPPDPVPCPGRLALCGVPCGCRGLNPSHYPREP